MKLIYIESGQNIIDIAIQEYGQLEAVETVCLDNGLAFDACLHAGQQLFIREAGIDEIPVIDNGVLAVYARKASKEKSKEFIINSRTPCEEVPGDSNTNLPSYYGQGPVSFWDTELTTIYRGQRQSENLAYTADLERLWYVYPKAYGQLLHAFQTGGYDAITSFDLLEFSLVINDVDVDYYAYRLKHDTYLTEADNFKISFE